MKLQLATTEEFHIVKKMALAFLKESPYKDLPKDESKVDNIIFSFLLDGYNKEKVCILCYSSEDEPIGIIAGYTNEAIFTSEKVASEVMWWVDPRFRGRSKAGIELLQAFEHWAGMVGSSFIQMQSLASLDDSGAIDKIYKRMGYEPKEISYLKRVN